MLLREYAVVTGAAAPPPPPPSLFEISRSATYMCCMFLNRDPNRSHRTATSLSWFPDGGQKLAVGYSCLEFQSGLPDTCIDSYIWDVGKCLIFHSRPDNK